jgi:hypothetical protein
VTKDSRITFRVASGVKKDLELIAKKENRSVAQICETFLRAGIIAYTKSGTKYLAKVFSPELKD